jgi:2-isopropylmalate synthase
MIKSPRSRSEFDKAVWSVHCHNDLGMAVANSLAAVRTGAPDRVHGEFGRRAGNTSLEEVVGSSRKDFWSGNKNKYEGNCPLRLVSVTGFVVQPNKAVVGANAFAHASGIHQDGVRRETYGS